MKTSVLLLLLLGVANGLLSFKMHRRLPQNERSLPRAAAYLPEDPLTGGSGFASYYIDVKVGTPPQTLRMDPDTGSSDFVVVTPACGCSFFGTGYSPAASRTAIHSTCGSACSNTSSPQYASCSGCSASFGCGTCSVTVSYGDGGAASGAVYSDVVALSPAVSAPIFLGAMSQASGKFVSFRDDGILGLAFPALASGVPTFMDQLAAAGVPNVFSACYGSFDGGEMAFGGFDPALVAPGNTLVLQVPVDKSKGYFGVTVSQFSMAGATYKTSFYNDAILDTGTTLLITTDPTFVLTFRGWLAAALRGSSAAAVAQGLINNPSSFTCFSREELSYFVPCLPPMQVSFVVNGVLSAVNIPASSYLWIYQSDNYCPGQFAVTHGVQYATSLPGGIDMILGDVFLRNLHTTYDRAGLTATFRLPNLAACGTPIVNVTDTTVCTKVPLLRLLPVWEIVLIAFGIAAVVLIVLLIVCCCCCCCKRKRHDAHHHHHHHVQDGATPGGGYTAIVYAPVGQQGAPNHAMAPFPTN